ncbi:helix-turn-helix domain-containing protein [Candidatus Dojkabacteria bacterium]|uniref:Helix-turn-helix domain-containing protein n=1 Tax=Candidatus Dojkabacteria bacterium TaxID=2099670 RepID=A0A5C7JA70_9BACT|nr:MAG: helix-turn-helix domain-containing protein [Candidatus Dojkabacteria bacterium]
MLLSFAHIKPIMRQELVNKNLVSIRESLRLNQQQFATALGVSTRTVSQWENGKVRNPRLTLTQTKRLMDMTGKTLDELVEIFEAHLEDSLN